MAVLLYGLTVLFQIENDLLEKGEYYLRKNVIKNEQAVAEV